MKRANIIYNPAAGRFPSRLLTERAATVLRNYGWEVTLLQTTGGDDISTLARKSAQNDVDVVFVAGGDGSIGYAVSGLVGSGTALAVLPAGTANVWAQELGLPGLTWTRITALEESAKMLADGVIKEVDVGLCNNTPFLLWAGIGLDAFIVHHIEPRSRWEKHFAVAQYATQAVMHLSNWRGMDLRVRANDVEIQGRYVVAIVSNIHLYAGGLAELSPQSRVDDGKMELWLFAGDTIQETIRHIWNLLSGNHVNSEDVRNLAITSVHLEADTKIYLQHDGEPGEVPGQEVDIKVLPRSLKVLVPQTANKHLFIV